MPSRWLRARPLFEVLMARVVARVMLHGLLVWHEYAHTQRAQMTKLRRAVSRWTGVTACRCMGAWRESTLVKKERRRLASRVVMRMMYRGLYRGLATWQEETRQRGRLRQLVRRLMSRGLSMALEAWMENARQQRRGKAICTRIVSHWTRRRSAAAFETWHVRAQEQVTHHGCRRVAAGGV